MRIKAMFTLPLIVAAAFLLVTNVPVHASQADNRIEKSVRKSYVFKTYLKGDGIRIKSEDGVVTLAGTVPEQSHKTMAEQTTLSLPGVKSVNNQLTVTPSPANARTDAWLRERVQNTLQFHRSVSRANTDVSVTDGKVTLRGKAASEAQKQLTSEYAKDVSGVKDVDNKMTVTKRLATSRRTASEKIDDASITTQVKMSLLFHRGTDVLDTQVSTHKGVVTLSGTAMNQAEIDLATKRVGDVHGVKRVNNQMTIEAAQSSTN
jgi:osmotically-inducible protein OsmY